MRVVVVGSVVDVHLQRGQRGSAIRQDDNRVGAVRTLHSGHHLRQLHRTRPRTASAQQRQKRPRTKSGYLFIF